MWRFLKKERSIKMLNVHFSLLLGAYWMGTSVFGLFMVPILRGRGFENIQISQLIMLRGITAILFQPRLAAFADRHPRIQLKYIIAGMLGVAFIATFIFGHVNFGYWGTLVLFIFFGMSMQSMTPFHSAFAMKYVSSGKQVVYSVARGIGSVCYAVGAVMIGQLVEIFGTEFGLTLMLFIIAFGIIVALTLDDYKLTPEMLAAERKEKKTFHWRFRGKEITAEQDSEQESKQDLKQKSKQDSGQAHSNWYLLTHYQEYPLFLLAAMLVFLGYNLCNNYLIDVVTKLGGTAKHLGYANFVLGMVELPTALLFSKLKKRFSVQKLLCMAAFFQCMKMLGIYLAPNVWVLIGVQVFQMLGNGLFWSSSVHYVNDTVDEVDRVKGQALTTIASTNAGNVIGASMSGRILTYYGIDNLILSGVCTAAVGVVLMFIAMYLSTKNKAARKARCMTMTAVEAPAAQ